MDFDDSFVLLLTCCSSHGVVRPFINRERRLPSYFPTPATMLLTFAARLRRFCQLLRQLVELGFHVVIEGIPSHAM